MKIMICGSMAFAKEMMETRNELEKTGHEVFLPADTQDCIDNPGLKSGFEKDFEAEIKHCIEKDVLKDGLDKIAKSDAIIHLNYQKNGVDGYIGPSGIMEIGVAFHLGRKIFLLYPVDKKQKYALEIMLTNPMVLNGDLTKIK